MNEKPEALVIADALDNPFVYGLRGRSAAAELRRLHAENEALTATRDRQAAILRRLEEGEAELDAEIGHLRRENERLREQIKDCDATIEALQSAVARAAQKVLAGT